MVAFRRIKGAHNRTAYYIRAPTSPVPCNDSIDSIAGGDIRYCHTPFSLGRPQLEP